MVEQNLSNSQTEDTFMQAVTRLENGEAFETILADYPLEEQDELRELLTVVAATYQLHDSAIPQAPPARRAANKRAFLQAAAEMKEATDEQVAAIMEQGTVHTATSQPEQAQATSQAAVTAVQAAPVAAAGKSSRAPVTAQPNLAARIRTVWSDFVSSLTPVSVRLAPLAVMLLAIWLASFGAFSAAQAAIPGDVAYPAKQWILHQELTLADVEDRAQVYGKIEDTYVKDTQRAAERGQLAEVQADLIFNGMEGDYLRIGKFYVEANYIDPVTGEEKSIDIHPRMPGEGEQVRLTYRVVPGATDGGTETTVANDSADGENETPAIHDSESNALDANEAEVSDFSGSTDGTADRVIVQGIALSVIENAIQIPPTATPTATATATATDTPLPTNTPTCSPWRPSGWTVYSVRSGDNLSLIAVRSGSTIAELQAVNCLANPDMVTTGARLYVPMDPSVPVMPTVAPTITPAPVTTTNPILVLTLTAVSTAETTVTVQIPTPLGTTIALTPTVTVVGTIEATTEASQTPDPVATAGVSVTATLVVTGTTVAPEATPTPTALITGTVGVTPPATESATAALTPEATPSGTVSPESGTTEPEGTEPGGTEPGGTITLTPESTPVPKTTAAATVATPTAATANPTATEGSPPAGTATPDESDSDEADGEVGGASGGESSGDETSTPTAVANSSTPTTAATAAATSAATTTGAESTATPVAPVPTATVTPPAIATATTSDESGSGGESGDREGNAPDSRSGRATASPTPVQPTARATLVPPTRVPPTLTPTSVSASPLN